MSSSWIKLDQSFSKAFQLRNRRNKRFHREITPASISNIEDDNSSESYPRDSNSSLIKKRKIKSLEDVEISNKEDSSNESGEVEYNPDGTQLPNIGAINKFKPTLKLSVSASTSASQSRHVSTAIQTNTVKSNSNWKSWKTFPKPANDINLTNTIDDSLTDSDDDSSAPVDIIDDCSSDSSQMQSQFALQSMNERGGSLVPKRQSQVIEETVIDTEESITPPVQPFLIHTTNKPKKRKMRVVKGGMVERLTKSLSKAKSDLLFWQHHRSAELVKPGRLVVVHRVEKTYGRTLIHAKVNGEAIIFSLCSGALEVEKDDVLEVEFDNCQDFKTDTHVLYSYVDKVLPIK